MKAPVIDKLHHDSNPIAKLNREALNRAGVFTVSLVGGPGCGKTSLIDALVQGLMPEVHVGVVTCDVTSRLDADRITGRTEQVVQVNTEGGGPLDASHIHDALRWLDQAWLDMLLIENVGTLVGPVGGDLGQDATVAMFSVAAGHDKASKHPELVQTAGMIVLNKTDLLPSVPFDIGTFRADVARLNPRAELFEVSALRGAGIEPLLKWFKTRAATGADKTSNWFG